MKRSWDDRDTRAGSNPASRAAATTAPVDIANDKVDPSDLDSEIAQMIPQLERLFKAVDPNLSGAVISTNFSTNSSVSNSNAVSLKGCYRRVQPLLQFLKLVASTSNRDDVRPPVLSRDIFRSAASTISRLCSSTLADHPSAAAVLPSVMDMDQHLTGWASLICRTITECSIESIHGISRNNSGSNTALEQPSQDILTTVLLPIMQFVRPLTSSGHLSKLTDCSDYLVAALVLPFTSAIVQALPSNAQIERFDFLQQHVSRRDGFSPLVRQLFVHPHSVSVLLELIDAPLLSNLQAVCLATMFASSLQPSTPVAAMRLDLYRQCLDRTNIGSNSTLRASAISILPHVEFRLQSNSESISGLSEMARVEPADGIALLEVVARTIGLLACVHSGSVVSANFEPNPNMNLESEDEDEDGDDSDKTNNEQSYLRCTHCDLTSPPKSATANLRVQHCPPTLWTSMWFLTTHSYPPAVRVNALRGITRALRHSSQADLESLESPYARHLLNYLASSVSSVRTAALQALSPFILRDSSSDKDRNSNATQQSDHRLTFANHALQKLRANVSRLSFADEPLFKLLAQVACASVDNFAIVPSVLEFLVEAYAFGPLLVRSWSMLHLTSIANAHGVPLYELLYDFRASIVPSLVVHIDEREESVKHGLALFKVSHEVLLKRCEESVVIKIVTMRRKRSLMKVASMIAPFGPDGHLPSPEVAAAELFGRSLGQCLAVVLAEHEEDELIFLFELMMDLGLAGDKHQANIGGNNDEDDVALSVDTADLVRLQPINLVVALLRLHGHNVALPARAGYPSRSLKTRIRSILVYIQSVLRVELPAPDVDHTFASSTSGGDEHRPIRRKLTLTRRSKSSAGSNTSQRQLTPLEFEARLANGDCSKLIEQLALAIMSYLSNDLCGTDTNSVHSRRRWSPKLTKLAALESIRAVIDILGSNTAGVVFTITSSLTHSLHDEYLRTASLTVWRDFIGSLSDSDSLQIAAIAVLELLELLNNSDSSNNKIALSAEQRELVISAICKAFKVQYQLCDSTVSGLFSLPESIPEFEEAAAMISASKPPIGNEFNLEYFTLVGQFLFDENSTMVKSALQEMFRLLHIHGPVVIRSQLLQLSESGVNPSSSFTNGSSNIMIEVFRRLLQLSASSFSSNSNAGIQDNTSKRIRHLAAQCLGIIGAIDIGQLLVSNNNNSNYTQFPSNMKQNDNKKKTKRNNRADVAMAVTAGKALDSSSTTTELSSNMNSMNNNDGGLLASVLNRPSLTFMTIPACFMDAHQLVTFVLGLVGEYLVRAYQSSYDPSRQEKIAFAIQEQLQLCCLNRETIASDFANTAPGERWIKEKWDSLPNSTTIAIHALMDSSYRATVKERPPAMYPIYAIFASTTNTIATVSTTAQPISLKHSLRSIPVSVVASVSNNNNSNSNNNTNTNGSNDDDYAELDEKRGREQYASWLLEWCRDLTRRFAIHGSDFKRLADALYNAAISTEIETVAAFMPHLMLNVLLMDSSYSSEVATEIVTVLSDGNDTFTAGSVHASANRDIADGVALTQVSSQTHRMVFVPSTMRFRLSVQFVFRVMDMMKNWLKHYRSTLGPTSSSGLMARSNSASAAAQQQAENGLVPVIGRNSSTSSLVSAASSSILSSAAGLLRICGANLEDSQIKSIGDTLTALLARIPHQAIAIAAQRCGDYPRAMLHFELSMRTEMAIMQHKPSTLMHLLKDGSIDGQRATVTKLSTAAQRTVMLAWSQMPLLFERLDLGDAVLGVAAAQGHAAGVCNTGSNRLASTFSESPEVDLSVNGADAVTGGGGGGGGSCLDEIVDRVTGKWHLVQARHEHHLNQDPTNLRQTRGLISSLMALGHYESALAKVQNLHATHSIYDAEIDALGQSAAWRLGRWDVVSNSAGSSSSSSSSSSSEPWRPARRFDASLGQLLDAIRCFDAQRIHAALDNCYDLALQGYSMSGSASVAQSHRTLTRLHALHDAQQLIYFMSNLEQSHSADLDINDEEDASNDPINNVDVATRAEALFNSWQLRAQFLPERLTSRSLLHSLHRSMAVIVGECVSKIAARSHTATDLVGFGRYSEPDMSLLVSQMTSQIALDRAILARSEGSLQAAYSSLLEAVTIRPEMRALEQARWLWDSGQQNSALDLLRDMTRIPPEINSASVQAVIARMNALSAMSAAAKVYRSVCGKSNNGMDNGKDGAGDNNDDKGQMSLILSSIAGHAAAFESDDAYVAARVALEINMASASSALGLHVPVSIGTSSQSATLNQQPSDSAKLALEIVDLTAEHSEEEKQRAQPQQRAQSRRRRGQNEQDEQSVKGTEESVPKESTNRDPGRDSIHTAFIEAFIQQTKWTHDLRLLPHSTISHHYSAVVHLRGESERTNFARGSYYNLLYSNAPASTSIGREAGTITAARIEHLSTLVPTIIKCYTKALCYGNEYIYQTLPRVLTLWLEAGEDVLRLQFRQEKLIRKHLEDVEKEKEKEKEREKLQKQSKGRQQQLQKAEDDKNNKNSQSEKDIVIDYNINVTYLGGLSPNAFRRMREAFEEAQKSVSKMISRVPSNYFLTVFPQIVSRICHPHPAVQQLLDKMILYVLSTHSYQALWQLMSASRSTNDIRKKRCDSILKKASVGVQVSKSRVYTVPSSVTSTAASQRHGLATGVSDSKSLIARIDHAKKLSDHLQRLCDHPVGNKVARIHISAEFRSLIRMLDLHIDVIVPLQRSLSASIPSSSSMLFAVCGADSADRNSRDSMRDRARPLPDDLPKVHGISEYAEIMPSLQKPKKIALLGSDGVYYKFLCKPKDDLRKDARFMEFNTVMNKLFARNADSRSSHLHIRTYAVVPLNEECGLIEWVNHTIGLRHVLNNIYKPRGLMPSMQQLRSILDLTKPGPAQVFTNILLPKLPPVMHEWFLDMFPTPERWLQSRLAFTRTCAVMSMIGFLLGLGDRHGENILLDELSGDVVHVDFNCLFEKGVELEKPERVPFRLTHNMVDAMGPTGYEGTFRSTSEVVVRLIREQQNTLMTILETFVHDPLVDWTRKPRNTQHESQSHQQLAPQIVYEYANKALQRILQKARGTHNSNALMPLSPEGLVDEQILIATNPALLFQMYIGWAAYL